MKISPLYLSDIDRVHSIEQSVGGSWSRQAFVTELSKDYAKYYVARDKGNIVIGFIGIWLIVDEGHLVNFAVDPEYQGKGYGKQLLAYLIQKADAFRLEEINLEVRQSNIIAQNLYKRVGFHIVGIRKNYYQDNNEDAILMQRC